MRVFPGDKGYQSPPHTKSPRAAPPPIMDLTPDWRTILNASMGGWSNDKLMQHYWTRYVYDDGMLDYLNDEWERYRETGNHVVTDNALKLTALPHNGDFWPSGMLRSKDCYPIGDGNEWYFEARLRAPKFLGCWPAFWIAGSERNPGDDQSVPWPPEIDQCEIVNNGQDDTTHMLHCGAQVLNWDTNPQGYEGTWAVDNYNWQWMYYWSDDDLAAGFHTYGLYYKEPEAIVYLDREPILAFNYSWVSDDHQPMPGCYLFANLAVGGSWAGRYGVDNEALPQSLDVDYIRVFQRVPQSTIGHDLLTP
jgi:beta-glucanase (GH16 family)